MCKMLILEKTHKNVYAAGSIATSSFAFKQKTMVNRPFILNIPLYLKIQFSLWKLLLHNPSKRAPQNSSGKTSDSLKSLRRSD